MDVCVPVAEVVSQEPALLAFSAAVASVSHSGTEIPASVQDTGTESG